MVMSLYAMTAGAEPIDLVTPFLGEYEGKATYQKNDKDYTRNLNVAISQTDNGFNVSWAVTTIKPSGDVKTGNFSIDFISTDRPSVFQAAQRKNIFGGMDPLDPMKGEPYSWARITGKRLSVFALLINDDGGYELLVYDRTLAENGLDLRFTRIKDGQETRIINSHLKRL